MAVPCRSKLVLQRKLHLPRRTRITRRETRVRDLAKIRSTDDAAGLTEICVVEQIENFPAELDQLRFRQLRALDERQVRVVEPWSNHNITAEVPKPSHRHDKRADIEPARNCSNSLDWTSHVRPHRVVGSREPCIVNDDIHRIPTLRLHDRR